MYRVADAVIGIVIGIVSETADGLRRTMEATVHPVTIGGMGITADGVVDMAVSYSWMAWVYLRHDVCLLLTL